MVGHVLAAVIGTPLVVVVGYWIWFAVAVGDCAEVIRALLTRVWDSVRPAWISLLVGGLLAQLFLIFWMLSLPLLPRFIAEGWYVGLWMILPVAGACLHGLVFWYVRTTLWNKLSLLAAAPVFYAFYRMLVNGPSLLTWEPLVLVLGLIVLWAGILQRELVRKWSRSSRSKRIAKVIGVAMMAALFMSAPFLLRYTAFMIAVTPTISVADVLVTDWSDLEPDKARDKKASVCILFALGLLNLWSGWNHVLTEVPWLVHR